MSLFRQMALLAVHQVLGDRAGSLLAFVSARFGDHTRKIDAALRVANERAWRCLEIALAGSTWWNACQRLLTPRDEMVLREQIERFLAGLPSEQTSSSSAEFRKQALRELLAARKVGLVPGAELSGNDLADEIQAFSCSKDTNLRVQQELDAVAHMADLLRRESYHRLADYISLRPAGSKPLLVQAAHFFFRREIETDEELARGLTHDHLQGLDSALVNGLNSLWQALDQHGQRLEQLLGNIFEVLSETREDVRVVREKVGSTLEVVSDTRDEVRGLQDQLARQSLQIQQLSTLLQQLLDGRSSQPAPVTAPAAIAPTQDVIQKPSEQTTCPITDWQAVRDLLARARRLGSRQGAASSTELARVADQLAEATQSYETTQANLLRHESHKPLVAQVNLPSPSAKRRPRLSDLFAGEQVAPPTEEPAAETGPLPAIKKPLLSPLFEKRNEEQG